MRAMKNKMKALITKYNTIFEIHFGSEGNLCRYVSVDEVTEPHIPDGGFDPFVCRCLITADECCQRLCDLYRLAGLPTPQLVIVEKRDVEYSTGQKDLGCFYHKHTAQ